MCNWYLSGGEKEQPLQLRRKLGVTRDKQPILTCVILILIINFSVHSPEFLWVLLQSDTSLALAIPSQGTSQPRDWTQVSHIVGRFFTNWATREVPYHDEHTDPCPGWEGLLCPWKARLASRLWTWQSSSYKIEIAGHATKVNMCKSFTPGKSSRFWKRNRWSLLKQNNRMQNM